ERKIRICPSYRSLKKSKAAANKRNSALLPRTDSRIGYDPRGNEPIPDEQHDQSTNSCADETRALIRAVPADHLAKPGRDECARDTQNSSEYEARGVIRPWREHACDNAGHEANENDPEDAHARSYQY